MRSPTRTQTDLRDVFAAHALQGLLADPSLKKKDLSDLDFAEAAYELAESMMLARHQMFARDEEESK